MPTTPAGPPVFDIAIVGAGIVGASIAAELARLAAGRKRVAMFEAESAPGFHSTGRSAAVFEEGYGPTQVRALTRASRAWFEAATGRLASTPLLHARPALFAGRTEDEAALRALETRLRAEGLTVRWLGGTQARAQVPVLRESASHCALLDEGTADIDVHALLQARLREAIAGGVAMRIGARVARLESDGGRWRLLDSGGSPIATAVTIVNAAGAWADELARAAGARTIGLVPRRRSAFVFEPNGGLDVRGWPSVIAADESWYFKPDAGLLLASPANADDSFPHDVQPEELDIATGIARIEEATTLTIRRPKRSWAGLRSFVADGEPVVGFDDTAPGFFWAAALGGYGIQSSPAVGLLAAALLLDSPLPEALHRQGVVPAALGPQRLCRATA
jgi:D-arginine dehydrogenase